MFKSCGIKEVSTAVARAAVMGNNQKETAQALLQAGFGVGVLRLRGGYHKGFGYHTGFREVRVYRIRLW